LAQGLGFGGKMGQDKLLELLNAQFLRKSTAVSGFSSFFLANKLEYFTRRPLPLKCDQLQTLNNSFVPLEKPATSRFDRTAT